MAIKTKIAGVVAGLGFGLGAGVLLAVLNPLISNTDSTAIQSTPAGAGGNLQQDAAPSGMSLATDSIPVIRPAPRPVPGQADRVPTTDSAEPRDVRAGRVGGIAAPAEIIANPVAVPVAEDQSKPAGETASALPDVIIDPSPDVSTEPAKPIQMAEPEVETGAQVPLAPSGGGAVPTGVLTNPVRVPVAEDQSKPAGEATSALPDVVIDPSPDVSTEPAKPIEMAEPEAETAAQVPRAPSGDTETKVATPDPDAGAKTARPKPIEPAGDVVVLLPREPQNLGQPPKKLRFDTGASRLKTTGKAGFGDRSTGDSGAALPKIGAAGPDLGAVVPEALPNALAYNSVPYEKTDKPMMSVVLIDLGEAGVSLDILAQLTLPVTFAIPADSPSARARTQAFRAAGFEVLALLPRSGDMRLTGTMSQDDISSRLDRILAAVPQAIGLIDQPKAEFQKNRKLAKAVIARLQPGGYGLITYYKGLNTVPREAQLAGLAAGSVQRVLDGKGETGKVITRYMDRAILDARRTGYVIILGTTAKTTVTALVNWALGSKARGVSLAPVSAPLRESLE